ncbi:endolytic transglycosylase MltG [Heyndrickxia vini]|uniref:Endolytic transglycosylase MltG n=1 Tax=Heyndrickxia vini TaxID=1476025 RepID=A0ABX7E6K6_9BACI|nr:endolytic transglycosylase MltG [Heyndrickxia vini]QQZ10856.1 endolytic transglycosylase MltG [Heyndrickxia vini]
MSKQTTRAFALGLLLSAILILVFKPFDTVHKVSTVKEGYEQIKKTDLKQLQQEKAQWEEKYHTLAAQKNDQTTNKEKTQTTAKTGSTQNNEMIKYRLTIKSGMTPYEIGENLKAAKIIKDDDKFVQFLIKHKYHEKIQLGKFNLNNKMNFEKIAVVITKGK